MSDQQLKELKVIADYLAGLDNHEDARHLDVAINTIERLRSELAETQQLLKSASSVVAEKNRQLSTALARVEALEGDARMYRLLRERMDKQTVSVVFDGLVWHDEVITRGEDLDAALAREGGDNE